jgi:hypothetical protein
MGGRLVLGSFLGAVVIMMWGFLFWVVSPFSFSFIRTIPNEEIVTQILKDYIPETGVYYFPGMEMENLSQDKESAERIYTEKIQAGPVGQIFIRKEGVIPMNPMTFVYGFVHSFISALFVGLILLMTFPRFDSYGSRVLFIFLLGLFSAIWTSFSDPIWWHHPWGYHLLEASYSSGSWLFASFIMAGILRPRPRF